MECFIYVDPLYLPTEIGGRVLIAIENCVGAEERGLTSLHQQEYENIVSSSKGRADDNN